MDPKIFGPKWSLFRDKESYVATWFLSLLPSSCRGLQFLVATYFHAIFFDSVPHNFTLSRHSSVDVVCSMS